VRLRWMLVPMLALGALMGGEPQKPVCNAQNRGRLWPEGAARGTCRSVEICTVDVWKYRWEPVTISVSQLSRGTKRKSGCAADHAEPPKPLSTR
jgi:hypothetical protein